MSDSDMPKLDPPAVSEPKKRGRPKGSKNAPKNPASVIVKEAPRSPSSTETELSPATLTNEEVGRVFGGTFMLASLPLGPHWRLFPHEETEFGRCFGPIFRRYPDKVGPWMDALMCGPIVAAVVIPRIGIEKYIRTGELKKDDARDALRVLLSAVEAEKQSSVASLKEEQIKFQEAVKARQPVTEEPKTDVQATGAIPGVAA